MRHQGQENGVAAADGLSPSDLRALAKLLQKRITHYRQIQRVIDKKIKGLRADLDEIQLNLLLKDR